MTKIARKLQTAIWNILFLRPRGKQFFFVSGKKTRIFESHRGRIICFLADDKKKIFLKSHHSAAGYIFGLVYKIYIYIFILFVLNCKFVTNLLYISRRLQSFKTNKMIPAAATGFFFQCIIW